MYTRISSDDKYPKTLVIRNHLGGMIWQVYYVENESEAVLLSNNATSNGFQEITLEDYQEDLEQNWPDWRETGKKLVEAAKKLEELKNK